MIYPQSRRGVDSEDRFSLVELLIVLGILGILANIAGLLVFDSLDRTAATRVSTDFDVVRSAVQKFQLDKGGYPRGSGWSRVPRQLVDYLPPQFDFEFGDVDYRFQPNWRRQAGFRIRVPRNRAALLTRIESNFVGTAVRLSSRQIFAPFGSGARPASPPGPGRARMPRARTQR